MTQLHSPTLRLGLAQTHNHFDYDLNFQSIQRAIETFAGHSVDLILFPECATTGYNRGMLKIDHDRLLAMVDQIKFLAKKYSVFIALPTPWPTDNGKFTNSVLIIDSEGRITQQFDKIGFQAGEEKLFVQGISHSRILNLKGHKLAFLICIEMEQDPWDYLGRNDQFDIVLWPGFYASDEGKTWEQESSAAELKTKANIKQLNSPIVRVTCASSPEAAYWPGKKFGGSLIFDKKAVNVFTAQLEGEDMIAIEVRGRDVKSVLSL